VFSHDPDYRDHLDTGAKTPLSASNINIQTDLYIVIGRKILVVVNSLFIFPYHRQKPTKNNNRVSGSRKIEGKHKAFFYAKKSILL
jgi:hypothetical protein